MEATTLKAKIKFLSILLLAFIPIGAYATSDTTHVKQEMKSLKKQLARLEKIVTQQGQKNQNSQSHKTATIKKENPSDSTSDIQTTQSPIPTANWNTNDIDTVLTGYGSANFIDPERQHSSFGTQFSPIFLFRYKDLLLWESELEFKLNTDGSTKTVLEYGALDWFMNDYMILVGGKFLSPLGYFFRNLHPAWINKLPSNPVGFGHDGAAPEADVGLQLRGGFPIRTSQANYSVYVANGPQAKVEDGEIHGIEAEGFPSDRDGHKVLGARIGFLPIPSLEIGLSGATGKIGLFKSGTIIESSRTYCVLGADASYRYSNLDLRGEFIQQRVNSKKSSSVPSGGTWKAWYVQGAYRFFETPWEGVVRYGDFSSPHDTQKQKQWTLGLDYWFGPSAVAKAAYEFNHGKSGSTTNNDRALLELAFGF